MAVKPRKQIAEAKQALRKIMQEHLAEIGQVAIDKLITRTDKLTDAKALEALKVLQLPRAAAYRTELLTGLAVVAHEAIELARTEIPGGKKIKLSAPGEEAIQLSEFDTLPAALQKRLKTQAGLLVDTHLADLEKAVAFQFTSSVGSTDSMALLRKDLEEAAEDFITGVSIDAGAAATAATVVNAARQTFFSEPEVMEQIDAFQFVNGDPVSPICQDLAGKIFAKDDQGADRYYPPLHFNCKSFVVPILTGKLGNREVEELKPSKTSLDEYVQLSEADCSCGLDCI